VTEIDLTAPANVPNASSAAQHQKIEKAAREFEGLLLSALWKSMGEDIKDSSEGDSSSSSFIDMGLQAVGSAMAASGGIGIGRMLLKALEKQSSADANPAMGQSNGQRNTEIR
jgi:Rod binding domain-containing protein